VTGSWPESQERLATARSGSFAARQAARWAALVEEVRRRAEPGAAVEPAPRRLFEGHVGDVSAVMVHRGPFAGFLAHSAGAAAATVEGHVLGGDTQLDASTRQGTALLGHELVHAATDTLGASRPGESQPAFGPSAALAGPAAPVGASAPPAPAVRRAALPDFPAAPPDPQSPEDEEAHAQALERSVGRLNDEDRERRASHREQARLAQEALIAARPARVADAVYRRLVDQVRFDRERGVW
jgi:hypothetical protein